MAIELKGYEQEIYEVGGKPFQRKVSKKFPLTLRYLKTIEKDGESTEEVKEVSKAGLHIASPDLRERLRELTLGCYRDEAAIRSGYKDVLEFYALPDEVRSVDERRYEMIVRKSEMEFKIQNRTDRFNIEFFAMILDVEAIQPEAAREQFTQDYTSYFWRTLQDMNELELINGSFRFANGVA